MKPTDDLQNNIIEIIQNQLDTKIEIGLTTTFAEIKLNSIAFVKIIVRIEDELGINFNLKMIDIEQYITIKDLIDYIEDLVNHENNK